MKMCLFIKMKRSWKEHEEILKHTMNTSLSKKLQKQKLGEDLQMVETIELMMMRSTASEKMASAMKPDNDKEDIFSNHWFF